MTENKTYKDCLQFAREHQVEFGAEYQSPEEVVQVALKKVSFYGNWNDVYAQLDVMASYYWTPIN